MAVFEREETFEDEWARTAPRSIKGRALFRRLVPNRLSFAGFGLITRQQLP